MLRVMESGCARPKPVVHMSRRERLLLTKAADGTLRAACQESTLIPVVPPGRCRFQKQTLIHAGREQVNGERLGGVSTPEGRFCRSFRQYAGGG
jgi:hypothetical protein